MKYLCPLAPQGSNSRPLIIMTITHLSTGHRSLAKAGSWSTKIHFDNFLYLEPHLEPGFSDIHLKMIIFGNPY